MDDPTHFICRWLKRMGDCWVTYGDVTGNVPTWNYIVPKISMEHIFAKFKFAQSKTETERRSVIEHLTKVKTR